MLVTTAPPMIRALQWRESMYTRIRSDAYASGECLSGEISTALVHERLNVLAGSEKVVITLHDLFPRAPIFTAFADRKLVAEHLPNAEIKTSFLQKMPLVAKHHHKFLPLYMLAFEQFDLSDYDLVISSCHCASKAVITKPDACHICYCHSPMRYAWDMRHVYTRHQNRAVRSIWSLMANYVRMWDLATAYRVDYFVANSGYIARRILKFYGRESVVIHPPVEIQKFYVSPSVDDYYLVVSRFAPYKRVDLVVEAFNQLGWRLVVIGDGEQEAYLKQIAGPNVEFKGYVSDKEMSGYLAHCKALVHAAEEDFGINMVEAHASGRPVVAYGVGGSADIVDSEVNGVLFQRANVESLIAALRECEGREWDTHAIRQTSLRFDTERFKREFAMFVDWALDDFNSYRQESGRASLGAYSGKQSLTEKQLGARMSSRQGGGI